MTGSVSPERSLDYVMRASVFADRSNRIVNIEMVCDVSDEAGIKSNAELGALYLAIAIPQQSLHGAA